jgi:hypothetical protein
MAFIESFAFFCIVRHERHFPWQIVVVVVVRHACCIEGLKYHLQMVVLDFQSLVKARPNQFRMADLVVQGRGPISVEGIPWNANKIVLVALNSSPRSFERVGDHREDKSVPAVPAGGAPFGVRLSNRQTTGIRSGASVSECELCRTDATVRHSEQSKGL